MAVGRLEARSQVGGVADDGVTAGFFRADVAGDNFPGSEADAEIHHGQIFSQAGDFGKFAAEDFQFGELVEGALASEDGVFAGGAEGFAPIRHDGIADELVDHTLGAVDGFAHQPEVAVQQVDEAGGGELFADRGEADQIAEADCHNATIADGGGGVGVEDDFFHDPGVDIFAKCFLELGFAAELLGQIVEGVGKGTDFVGRKNGKLDGEISLFHVLYSGQQGLDRLDHPAGDDVGEDKTEKNGGSRGGLSHEDGLFFPF